MAARSELRRKARRQFQYNASVLLDGKSLPQPCAIADISETGARIVLATECNLPERFILLLTRKGEARRHCRGDGQAGAGGATSRRFFRGNRIGQPVRQAGTPSRNSSTASEVVGGR